VLNPALSRKSVAVLPTSTSNGADACIVVGIDSIEDLRGQPVYGLDSSVSEYAFVRGLELAGEKEEDHQFTNMDPAAAAQAMQTGSEDHTAIMVWNPFVLQTLKVRDDAKVLFDSSTIPGEIVDMVVVAEDALSKPGGKAFACAIIDAYYEMNRRLADPDRREELLAGQAGQKVLQPGRGRDGDGRHADPVL
jgi:NitT/TauT family transport system substrate-binding protein